MDRQRHRPHSISRSFSPSRRPVRPSWRVVVLFWIAIGGVISARHEAAAQVRTKTPDRGVYRPPQLSRDEGRGEDRREPDRREGGLVDVTLRPVSHDEIRLEPVAEAERGSTIVEDSGWPPRHPAEAWGPGGSAACGCEQIGCDSYSCDPLGCDSDGCDTFGCDDPACGGHLSRHRVTNADLPLDPARWFGTVEVLLMFRKGDTLPPLVTTGAADDPDTAGQIGEPGTENLFGGERLLDEMTVGGRFTVGAWLDSRQCRALTVRGWLAGRGSESFHAGPTSIGVLTRPFLDVSDGQPPEQNTQLVAFPDRVNGSIGAHVESEVFGADVAVRQFHAGGYGGTVDLLYGYQYMRLNEGLGVRSSSISLDNDFAPAGAVIEINDSFDAKNEFHGGQLGIASRYREGCWSFDGMAKVGFGQLRREARRRGTTFTSIDGVDATTSEGLLVRESNRGTVTDHTFGWVPELDLSLGWHQFPRFDVTVGYHLIVMTDALRPSGMIDADLAADLGQPPVAARPSPALRTETFYVQGIHFGLQYAY